MSSVSSGRIEPTTANAARGPTRFTTTGAAIEPSATPPIARPHTRPSTRVSVSSGTIRCSKREDGDVLEAVRGADDREQNDVAARKYGRGAMSMSGRPQATSASPKTVASLLPFSVIAPSAPIRPPTPIAAVR